MQYSCDLIQAYLDHEIWFLKMNTLWGAPSISSLLASLSFHVLSSPSKLLWQQSFAEAQCLLPAGRHTAGSLWSVFVKKMSRYLITLAAGLTSAPKFSLQFNIIHEFNWKLTSDYSPNHDNENCDSLLVSCFTLVGFAVYVRNYCRRNFFPKPVSYPALFLPFLTAKWL